MELGWCRCSGYPARGTMEYQYGLLASALHSLHGIIAGEQQDGSEQPTVLQSGSHPVPSQLPHSSEGEVIVEVLWSIVLVHVDRVTHPAARFAVVYATTVLIVAAPLTLPSLVSHLFLL